MAEPCIGFEQPGVSTAFARQPGINGVKLVVNRHGNRDKERNLKMMREKGQYCLN